MARCDFCKKTIEPGVGKIKITLDGKVHPLCGSKCEKNMFKLKRNPRYMKWTEFFQSEKKALKKGKK